mgnify:CR=1 FL=1
MGEAPKKLNIAAKPRHVGIDAFGNDLMAWKQINKIFRPETQIFI